MKQSTLHAAKKSAPGTLYWCKHKYFSPSVFFFVPQFFDEMIFEAIFFQIERYALVFLLKTYFGRCSTRKNIHKLTVNEFLFEERS